MDVVILNSFMKSKRVRTFITALFATLTIFSMSASAFSFTLTPGQRDDYKSSEPVMSAVRMMGNNLARMSGSYMLFSASGHLVRATVAAVKAFNGFEANLREAVEYILGELGIIIEGIFEENGFNPEGTYSL